jgi:hypothetical protein
MVSPLWDLGVGAASLWNALQRRAPGWSSLPVRRIARGAVVNATVPEKKLRIIAIIPHLVLTQILVGVIPLWNALKLPVLPERLPRRL